MTKKTVLLFLAILLLQQPLSANSLTNENGEIFDSGAEICANKTYTLSMEDNYSEILIVDSESRIIQNVYNSNSDTIDLVLPEKAGNIQILSTPYLEDRTLDYNSQKATDYKVIECEYEVIADEFSKKIPLTKFTFDDNGNLKAHNSDKQYKLHYQFLDGKKRQLFDFENPEDTIKIGEEKIVQFTETIDETVNYFELEINPKNKVFVIREVSSFEVKKIGDFALFKKTDVLLLIILILLYIILTIMHKRYKRKYKIQKSIRARRRGRGNARRTRVSIDEDNKNEPHSQDSDSDEDQIR